MNKGRQNPSAASVLEKGLPANIDAEKFVLGSILLSNGERFIEVAEIVVEDDFMLTKHRLIFRRMRDLHDRSEKIDRVTLANELMKYTGELESIDGLGYLVSLDDGLPSIANLDSYMTIIRDKSQLRRIVMASQQLMNRALMAEETPEEILASAQQTLLGLEEVEDKKALKSAGEVIASFEGGINKFLDPSKRQKGLSTGFTKFDEMTGGLHPGELIILAARPSMGKTALALNICWHVAARLFQPIAIFSLEMSQEALLTRMLCAAARVDSQRMRAGYLNEGERQKLRAAANQMCEAPIYIDDTAGLTLIDVNAKLKRMAMSGQKPALVIIDYLQLMSTRGRVENRNQEVSQLSRGMKLLSKEFGCPFVVLSQLNRATETRVGDHRPMLADLRDSGGIEQDADVIGFIFREEVYKRDREDLRGLAELILAKQRNGPVGKIDLVFLHAMTKFENRAEDMGFSESECCTK